MAFCTKCGFEFPDDARFCPKCGSVNLLVAPTEQQPPASPVAIEMKGTALFWLCFFFGFLGVHQFYSGNTRRGVFYLLMTALCGFLIVPVIVIGVLVIIDLWRISHGTFQSGNGVRYLPANLFLVWVVCNVLGAFLLIHSCHGVAGNADFSPRFFGGKNESELSRAAHEYMESESAYIQNAHSVGTWKNIGYTAPGTAQGASQSASKNFTYSDHADEGSGEGFRAELNGNIGDCPVGSTWRIFVRMGADGKVEYQPVFPANRGCKNVAPDFVQTKQTL